jgi:hypothetical protein
MKRCLVLFSALLAAGLTTASAAVPPPEQLLPGDTLLVATIPDADKARAAWNTTPGAMLWAAPEMKAFRDKFMGRLNSDVIAPIEKELGVKFADYTSLARGQVTFALFYTGEAAPGKDPDGVILIDTKDKSADAARLLADLKKRWADSGKALKTQRIRDVEFSTVSIDGKAIGKALEKTFPKPPGSALPGGDKQEGGSELCVGQSGSLLLIGNDPAAFEKVLVRLSGGGVAPLAEQANFSGIHSSQLRESSAYFWLNAKVLMTEVLKELEKERGAPGQDAEGGPSPTKIMDALGFSGIQSFGFYMNQQPDGLLAGLFVGAPEASRKGILQIFAPQAKDSAPPAFVPADATKFMRWRMDGQKAWASVESIVNSVAPGMLDFFLAQFNAGLRESNPDFDLKRMLIGNLGDDIISYEKPPRGPKLEDVLNAPALVLLGSPRADQLAGTLRSLAGIMAPPGAGGAKEREFLGRKIYSLPMPTLPGQMGGGEKQLGFAASGSYLAFSPDAPLLEEYLRGAEAQGRPLRELPGLNEAAQKVGGTGTGLYGYENQTETARLMYEAVRKDPEAFDKLFEGPMGMSPFSAEMRRNRQQWLDFTLLPEWSAIAKYFHYTVYAGSATADGLHFKGYSPNPPGLK